MTGGEKAALGFGGVAAVALVIGIVSEVTKPSPTTSSSPPPCCPEGEAFVGMAGTAPVCSPAATEAYPCPCGCTQAGSAACQGYTPMQGQWGCCPPGNPGCAPLLFGASASGCQAQCFAQAAAKGEVGGDWQLCGSECRCGPWGAAGPPAC